MKLLSYFLSTIFGLVFYIILLVFHPLQWIFLKTLGYNGHKWIVDLMNLVLIKTLLILGIRVRVDNPHSIPLGRTVLFVSNHQSVFDIPPIIWYFRKHHPKFVSKIELGKGIPSISFNLKHGGAALIDRKDPKQAISTLMNFGKNINAKKWSAAIFPEGTRSRDGKPKSFAVNGIKTVLKYNPDAIVVPLTINNSWKVFKYGRFPLGLGSPIQITTHAPIEASSMPIDTLIQHVEHTITTAIHN